MFVSSLKHIVWFSFILGCVVILINPIQVSCSLSSSSEEAEDDNCIRLPPTPKRTPVAGDSQLSIISLLKGGSEEIKAKLPNGTAYPEDVILILGNTGSGKTTLTQILASDLTRIHAVLTHNGHLVIVDDDEKIGAPTTVSRTLIPELVSFSSSNNTITYFGDCPGFDDNRGPEQDLAANLFLNQIIRKAKRVKLLFLVTHSSVQAGYDRNDFDLLAKHATEFVRNLGHFKTSIGLIVTKVNGFSHQGIQMKNKQIMSKIVEFLLGYNHTLHQKSLTHGQNNENRERISKKIQFVSILLQKDKDGKYSRISFSRNPENCGPLSNSTVVSHTKNLVTRLYENLEYSPVGNQSNFGYTLKDSTLLNIQTFAKQINNEATSMVAKIMREFTEWFDQRKLNVSGNTGRTIALIQKIKPTVNKFATKLPKTLVDLARLLSDSLGSTEYVVPVESEEFIVQQSDYLNFFDEATGTKVYRTVNDWHLPILNFRQHFEHWFVSNVHTLSRQVNKQVAISVQECMTNFSIWFDKVSVVHGNVSQFVSLLQDSRTEIENLSKNMSDSPVQISASLKSVLNKFGYSISNEFELTMAQQDEYLNYFDRNAESKVDRSVVEWHASILAFQGKYKNWLNSNFRVYEKEINSNIATAIKQLMSNLTLWLENSHVNQTISEAIDFIKKTRSEFGTMANLSLDSDKLLVEMAGSLRDVGYCDVGHFATFIEMQEQSIVSLGNATGTKVERNLESWQSPILSFQDKYSDWLRSRIQNLTREVNINIVNATNETIENFWNFFTLKTSKLVADTNLTRMSDLIKSSRPVVAGLTMNLPEQVPEFGQVVIRSFKVLGYETPPKFETYLRQQGNFLKYFDSVQGTRVDRTVHNWRNPIWAMQNEYNDWLRLTTQNLTDSVNHQIVKVVQATIVSFRQWFDNTKFIQNSQVKLLSVPVMQNSWSEIENFLRDAINLPDASEFATELKALLGKLGYILPYHVMTNMQEMERIFVVLDDARGVKVNRAVQQWTVPVLTFQQALEEYRDQTIQTIERFTEKINTDIALRVNQTFSAFTQWFEKEKFKENDNVTQTVTIMQSILSEIQALLINLPESPSKFSNAIKSHLQKVGFRVDKELETFLTEKKNDLKFFDKVQSAPVKRAVKLWSEPVLTLKENLEMYRDWYSFCGQLKTLLATYEFHLFGPENLLQNRKIRFVDMKNLLESDNVHWKRPKLPVNSSRINWLEFVQEHKISIVSDRVKEIETELTSRQDNSDKKHIKVLEEILRWGLNPVLTTCKNSTLSVTGTFIRFGEFLKANGELKGNCSGVNVLQIYAMDTVFIDTNLYAVGKELNVVVIAPKWQVIGNPHLNLDGAKGDSIFPLKASNGVTSGENGENGRPGNPGGPGGSFIGVVNSVTEASNLTLSVNGGDGGSGQDGGDGAIGKKGDSVKWSDWETHGIVLGRESKRGFQGYPGQPGGNGGSGGVGGIGGRYGYVHIKSLGVSKITIEQNEGRNGAGGLGGMGGKGGEGSDTVECSSRFFLLLIPMGSDCGRWPEPRGSNGENGQTGSVVYGLQNPKQVRTIVNVKSATTQYQDLFGYTRNKATIQFMRSLQ